MRAESGGVSRSGLTSWRSQRAYSPVLHGFADDARQVLLRDLPRRPHEQPLLLHRPVYQVVYVVLAVAEVADPARRPYILHEPYDYLRQGVLVGLLDALAREQLGDLPVTLRHGRIGKPERGRRGHDNRPPGRNEGVVLRVARRVPLVLEASDGVRAGVRDVDPGRAEAYSRERGPEHHRAPRLDILAVLDGAPEVLAAVLERLGRPYVRDGVGPLIRRPVVGALGFGALVVRLGEVGLGRVADHVEAAGRGHGGGHRYGEQGIDDAAVGPQ